MQGQQRFIPLVLTLDTRQFDRQVDEEAKRVQQKLNTSTARGRAQVRQVANETPTQQAYRARREERAARTLSRSDPADSLSARVVYAEQYGAQAKGAEQAARAVRQLSAAERAEFDAWLRQNNERAKKAVETAATLTKAERQALKEKARDLKAHADEEDRFYARRQRAQERELAAQKRAAESLQRQRSAALNRAQAARTNAIQNLASDIPGGRFLSRFGQIKKDLDAVRTAEAALGKESTSLATVVEALGGRGVVAAAGIAVLAAGLLALLGIGYKIVALGFSMAKAFASWGEEIYQARLKTGAGVETLSLLKVAAVLTGKSFEEAARGLGRYLKNLVDAEHGGKTQIAYLKAVGFTLADIKRASKDGDFALEKLFDSFQKLPAGPEKLNAILKIAGKSGAELLGIIDNIGGSASSLKEKAQNLGLIFTKEDVQLAHQFTVESKLLDLAWEGLKIRVGRVALPLFLQLISELNQWIQKNQGSIKSWAETFGEALRVIIFAVRQLIDELRIAFNLALAYSDAQTLNLASAYQRLQRVAELNAQIAARAEEFKAGRPFKLNLPDLPPAGAADLEGLEKKEQRAKTEFEKLQEQYQQLLFDIKSLQAVGSKEFALKFKVEELQRFKGDLEQILKLRHELGLALNTPLPSDALSAQALVHQLERIKKVRDEVRQVVEEQTTAEEKYAVAVATQSLPVVNAGIRAETKILTALRERKNAEQELTAELIAAGRLRKAALDDETGETKKAYETIKLGLTNRLNELEAEAKRLDVLGLLQQGGELKVQQELQGRLTVEQPQPPTELKLLADNSTKQVNALQNIERLLSGATGGSASNAAAAGQFNARDFLPRLQAFLNSIGSHGAITALGQSGTHNRFNLDHTNAIDVGLNPASANGRALIQFLQGAGVPFRAISAADIARGVKATAPHVHVGEPSHRFNGRIPVGTLRPGGGPVFGGGAPQAAEAATAEADVRVTAGRYGGDVAADTAKANALQAANERKAANIAANDEIAINEARLAQKLIDFDQDVALHRSRTLLQRRDEARTTDLTIKQLEEDLAQSYIANSAVSLRFAKDAEKSRLDAHLNLRAEITTLEDQIAHAGEDSADRYRVAYLSAIREVQQADEAAVASMIRSQVRLSQQTVYHADQANAKLLEFIAQQKGVTEIVADAKIGVIQRTFDGIDHALDRMIPKGNAVLSLVKEIIASLLKLAASRYFARLFGLDAGGQSAGSSAGAGGGNGSSGGGFLSTIQNIFSGGGNGGGGGFRGVLRSVLGGGPAGTPGFNPNGGRGVNLSSVDSYLSSLGTGSSPASAGAQSGLSAAGPVAALLANYALYNAAFGGNARAALGDGKFARIFGGFAANPSYVGLPVFLALQFLGLHRRHRDEQALAEAIKSEYQIQVRDRKVLETIKQIGEGAFGKGKVRQHLLETIRLEQSKEILSSYAQATGQKTSLVTNKQLQDPGFGGNNFIRRLTGGRVPFARRGYDYVRALLDGGEHIIDAPTVNREGHSALDALRANRATIVPTAPLPLSPAAAAPTNNQPAASMPTSMHAALVGALARVHEVLDRFEVVDGDKFLHSTVRRNPRVIADAVETSLGRGYRKPDLQRKLNLG